MENFITSINIEMCVPIFCWIFVSDGVKTSSTVGLSVVSSFSVAGGNKSPIDEKIVDKLILMESLLELPPPTVSVMYLQWLNHLIWYFLMMIHFFYSSKRSNALILEGHTTAVYIALPYTYRLWLGFWVLKIQVDVYKYRATLGKQYIHVKSSTYTFITRFN